MVPRLLISPWRRARTYGASGRPRQGGERERCWVGWPGGRRGAERGLRSIRGRSRGGCRATSRRRRSREAARRPCDPTAARMDRRSAPRRSGVRGLLQKCPWSCHSGRMGTSTASPGGTASMARAICLVQRRTRDQSVDSSTTTPTLHLDRFCWWGRLWSVVTRTSYPSCSARSSNSPLPFSDQPFSASVSTECPGRCLRNGAGVP